MPKQEKQETPIPCLGWGDPLEKGMVSHASILARKISWTEEPSGLQSMLSQSQTQLPPFSHDVMLFGEMFVKEL